VASISLTLLGGFQARRASGELLSFATRKSQALVAHLALARGRALGRDQLTALLWGEAGDQRARHSLRQALVEIRQALAPSPALEIEGEAVALAPHLVEVDALQLERLAAAETIEDLERGAALYQGDLLAGLNVREAAFDEWLVPERERFRETATGLLRRLLALHEASRHDDPAIRTALRLLALDALQEPVHRTLMALYARQHRRGAALRQYQLCLTALRRDLGVEPEPETTRLYQAILTGFPPDRPEPRGARRRPLRDLRAADTPLVGRAQEMARMEAVLDEAWRAGARVLVIRGVAGIGKTRLIEELAATASRRGGQLLVGRSWETEQILPLQPWIDAIRSGGGPATAAALGGLGAAARRRLAHLFPDLGEPPAESTAMSEEPGRLFEALADLAGALAHGQPILLALDDFQWADELSVRLLSFTGRRLGDHPVLLVAGIRDEDTADAPLLAPALQELAAAGRLDELALAPLGADDTQRLVRALGRFRGREAEETGQRIWALSTGNPFVVVETMRALLETRAGARAGVELPRSVRDFIAGRLARLGPTARRLVDVAAVIGREFEVELLQRAARLSRRRAAAGVEELVRRRIFASTGDRFEFDHDRIREVAAAQLLPAVARELHAAVGAALELQAGDRRPGMSDRLASHYVHAGMADKAITYLILFADTARQRYALDDALRALDQALGLVEALPPEGRDRRRLEIVIQKAWILSVLGRVREILDLLPPHAGAIERLADPALAAPYYFRLGLTHCFLGNLAHAEEAETRALAAAARCGDEVTAGQAHYTLALRASWLGESREGIAHGRQAADKLGASGRRDWEGLAWWALGLNYLLAGAFAEALAAAARVEAIAGELGEQRVASLGAYATAKTLTTMGEGERAVAAGRHALEISRDPVARATAVLSLGAALVELGDAAQALPLLEDAVERFGRFGIRHTLALAHQALGEAHLLAGAGTRARLHAEQALALQQALGSRWGMATARRLLAGIARAGGERASAEALLREALVAHESVGAPFDAARDQLALAELAVDRGDRIGATRELCAAHRRFVDLGAPRWAARSARLAAAAGIALPGEQDAP
jgi:DNA-binding SARP family transcriptional activator/tetratricopeptide (TPR) repeat protein